MTKIKPRPKVGDTRFEVEWCSKLAWYGDPEDSDVDHDRCEMSIRHFATREEAEAFAVQIWPVTTQTFGIVGITPEEFTFEDDDLYPRGHWETYGDTYFFEGENNDDGTPFFNH